jgi:hypothetical protein
VEFTVFKTHLWCLRITFSTAFDGAAAIPQTIHQKRTLQTHTNLKQARTLMRGVELLRVQPAQHWQRHGAALHLQLAGQARTNTTHSKTSLT